MRDRVKYENLRLIAAAAGDPLTVPEAKNHLRVLTSDEDEQIEALIQAATAHLDGRDGALGRALLTQTWEYVLDEFPAGDRICLPLPPVQSITSITYRDTNGNTQTFNASNYVLSADKHWRPYVSLKGAASWPGTDDDPDAVIIRAVHGYGSTAADVPMPIRQALLLLVGHLYENREAVGPNGVGELPLGAAALLAPYMLTTF